MSPERSVILPRGHFGQCFIWLLLRYGCSFHRMKQTPAFLLFRCKLVHAYYFQVLFKLNKTELHDLLSTVKRTACCLFPWTEGVASYMCMVMTLTRLISVPCCNALLPMFGMVPHIVLSIQI